MLTQEWRASRPCFGKRPSSDGTVRLLLYLHGTEDSQSYHRPEASGNVSSASTGSGSFDSVDLVSTRQNSCARLHISRWRWTSLCGHQRGYLRSHQRWDWVEGYGLLLQRWTCGTLLLIGKAAPQQQPTVGRSQSDRTPKWRGCGFSTLCYHASTKHNRSSAMWIAIELTCLWRRINCRYPWMSFYLSNHAIGSEGAFR